MFGKRLSEVRIGKKISQNELGERVGAHAAVIGRYERGGAKPSIEMATLLAQALEVSLDYLAGSTDILLDESVIKRMQDIQKLSNEQRRRVFALLDAFMKQENVLFSGVDENTRIRILEVDKFEEEDRNHIFAVIDAFTAKRKIKSIL